MAAGKGDVAVAEKRYVGEDKDRKTVQVYPKLTLELEDVPFLKKKKYNDVCEARVELRILNMGEQDHYGAVEGGQKPKPKVVVEVRRVLPLGSNSGRGDEEGYDPKKDNY